MKKLFIFGGIICSLFLISQTKAVTEDGKDVVLFDSGTWKFVHDTDKKLLENINSNDEIFTKNSESTFLVRSKRLNIGFYFNPKEWKISTQTRNPYMEFMFNDVGGDSTLAAFLLTENLEIPTYKNLKDILISGVQSRVDYFRLKESEYRTVNGLKVLYMRYIANVKGLDFEYSGYYYLEKTGYSGIVAFSSQSKFEMNLPKIEKLLNGLTYAEKAELKEVIEYSAPPPPMRSN